MKQTSAGDKRNHLAVAEKIFFISVVVFGLKIKFVLLSRIYQNFIGPIIDKIIHQELVLTFAIVLGVWYECRYHH